MRSSSAAKSSHASVSVASRTLTSALMGLALGICFPLTATAIALLQEEMTWSLREIIRLHEERPIVQLVDSIPILLMLSFAVFGRSRGKLEQTLRNVEAEVARRTADFQVAKDRAELAAKGKSNFLSRVSRDLNSAVETVVRAHEMVVGTAMDGRQQALARDALKKSKRVQDTLRSVMTYVDIDAGAYELHEQTFDPKDLLTDAINRLSARISRSLEFRCSVVSALPSVVQSDPQAILKVLITIVRTAILSQKAGEISVEISHTPAMQGTPLILHVEITAVQLQMSDYQRSHLFDAFERDDPMDFTQDSKLGLELAVADRLAKALHGDIKVTSSGVGGTRFTISIPVRESYARAA